MKEKHFYSLEKNEVLEHFHTTEKGLSKEEANKRLEQWGENRLPKGKKKTIFHVFFSQLKDPIVIILLVTTIISLFIKEYVDAIFILLVILLDAILGTFQEWKAEKSAASLQEMVKVKLLTLRDNQEVELDSELLVPGDIVYLEPGNKVSGDMRLLECHNLTVDEAFLTGESIAAHKKIEPITETVNPSEQHNMCFAGSTILSGRGIGLVVNTGIHTEIGKIATKVTNSEGTKTPLIIRMERFTKQISYLVAIVALLLTFVLYLKGYAPQEIFFLVVALSVSAIPEGLPVSLTIALSIAASRMAKKNVIVRKLNAVESLGSCTVIASDKTGTLTLNEQTIKKIVLKDGTTYQVEGNGYNGIGSIHPKPSPLLEELCKNAMYNNEAGLLLKDNEWIHHGDAMDVAFLSLAYKANLNPQQKENLTILDQIPYESENKYSALLYQDGTKKTATIKGSVETILSFCNEDQKEDILKQNELLAREGYRVLAVASKPYQDKKLTSLSDFNFLGLVAFLDPIRKEAKRSIKECHQAGIKVMIITGDHPLTAYAIGKELGLLKQEQDVVTGKQLETIENQSDFDKLIQKTTVFARTTPMQKLEIIESLKRSGEFVAVTGDGVNDAPALKSANIGIAMGSGTDVAKETGSMIITDDNFMSIVSGVKEGRYAYDNIRKVIYLLISCGIAEVCFFLFSILLNLPLPLVAIQLLWLNLVTDGIQDVALAFEGGEKEVMKRKPRNPKESIFNRLLLEETLLSGFTIGLIITILWFYLIEIRSVEIIHARTYILMTMVFMQNIHAFNCRSELTSVFKIPLKNNPLIVVGVLSALAIHLIVTQVPFLSHILDTVPIAISDILFTFIISLPLLLVMELYKYIKRRSKE